jgi:hypothetical protein
VHPLELLPYDDALHLFLAKLGDAKSQQEVCTKMQRRVVEACGRLPLAVAIVGGCLASVEVEEQQWQVTLRCICHVTLATCRPQRCSQVVVDALKGGDDPIHAANGESENLLARVLLHSLVGMRPAAVSMFLDVACVLQGQPAASAKAVWQQQWHEDAESCFRLLLTRNLLTVTLEEDSNTRTTVEVLQMHDVLKWLGRCVVRGESGAAALQEHVGSRLWVQDGSVVGGPCAQVWTLLQQLPPVRPALRMDPPLTCAILVCRATASPPLLQQHWVAGLARAP